MEGARRHLDLFRQKYNFRPDVHSFSSILHCCSKNGDATSASLWLEKMKEYSVKPDVVCFQSVMDAHSKQANADEACFSTKSIPKRKFSKVAR